MLNWVNAHPELLNAILFTDEASFTRDGINNLRNIHMRAHSDLGEHMLAVYSSWKLLDNYETCASVFVVLCNGFVSLTSYFDDMYRY